MYSINYKVGGGGLVDPQYELSMAGWQMAGNFQDSRLLQKTLVSVYG